MRKAFTLILTLILFTSCCLVLPLNAGAETTTMYVNTAVGKRLNVRSEPSDRAALLGKLERGTAVQVEFINSTGWAVILYDKGAYGEAYVFARYLSDKKPSDPKKNAQNNTAGKSAAEKEAAALKEEQKKLNKELASEHDVEPFSILVKPSRASGWVNFRVGPSKITTRITTFNDGKELTVVGETNNWYKARDPESGKTGFISKQYTTKVTPVAAVAPAAKDADRKLGTLNVNGEFSLTCRLPDGYDMQVVNMRGTRIVAAIQPEDGIRPQMYLSVAYDETYGEVERMNDMTGDELAELEATYREMNDVEITYAQTGYGTKLMVARETGADTDFVDILAIYKGYFIEFNMTPGANNAAKTLTDEQITMCIDFLTDLNFVPAAA